MNYTKKSFSVNAPGSKTYADNWERTFRGGPEPLLKTCLSHPDGGWDYEVGETIEGITVTAIAVSVEEPAPETSSGPTTSPAGTREPPQR